MHSWFQVTEINSSHLMQKSLVDYVVANLRHREIWGFTVQDSSEMSPFSIPYHDITIFLLNISIDDKYGFGGFSSLMVMNIWEHVWIFHLPYQPNKSLAGSHACSRTSDAWREKRKPDYLAQESLQFLFWKLWHGTYCHSQTRDISREASTGKQT